MKTAEEFFRSKNIGVPLNSVFTSIDGNEYPLFELVESYTKQHADKRCESCMHSYHKKGARGYHDVEEFYKD